jgi:PAS domain S-box-containing protein
MLKRISALSEAPATREDLRQELYRAAFDNAPDAILLLDDERRYLDGNRAARSFLGVSRLELGQSRVEDFTPESDLGRLERLWALLKENGVLDGRFPIRLRNGLVRTVRFYAVAGIAPGRHMVSIRLADESGRSNGLESPSRLLTVREREVLTYVARGSSVRDIATAAALSTETVRTHIRNATRKLGAGSRPHAVAIAIRERHIEP